ncbi:MAG: acyl-[acyl-carrier-protein] thioesterase [Prevotellaceae bacterium]|jgi:acyl-ACP thioesterase|nr:acyl-[acyl-carrier-protein] thioesterase [Prevotellaceae bacterium]
MTTNHKFTFEVTPQDVDFTRRITLVSLGNYILNTAGTAASLNNFGLETLLNENLAWVVSRLAIEMKYYPVQYEQFSIETWVEDYGKLFTTRNFKVFDKKSNVIGAASSVWAVINLNTRRPYSLQNKMEWNRFATGIGAGIEKPVKIDETVPEIPATAYHTVCYSDIDFNQHTNSMKYVQWLADTFDLTIFEQKNIIRFDANYIHEARFGEKTAIFVDEKENKTLCGIKNSDNNLLCKIRLVWGE